MDAPTLTTSRLLLRSPRIEDFDASFAMWSDPGVTRFIGGRPQTREETWARLLRYIGHWRAFGWGFWIVTTPDGTFVGECGFADFHREIDPRIDLPEMGWVLAPHAHGRGLASEAAWAAAAWGDAHLASSRTTCIIDPENTSSLAVAARTGFGEVRRADYRGAPIVILERKRSPT